MERGVRVGWLMLAALATTMPSPGSARPKDRPITSREPDAIDVAKTPMTDLNIARTEIPALLIEAEKRPYSTVNLDTCAQLVTAVTELDAMLGPDLDLPQSERARFSKGRIAQWAVGTFIPFRSLIREVSGANRQERQIRDAIQAGLARRGFLKGLGIAKNCPYPASPATETILAQHASAMARPEPDAAGASDGAATTPTNAPDALPTSTGTAPQFTSQPVVQPTQPKTR